MEVEAALRRFLLDQAVVTGYVGTRVWKDKLEDVIDGSGQRALVVGRVGGWAPPQLRNTQEYPIVRVEFWADHTRNEDGSIRTEDGLTSCYAMYRAIDPLLHGKRDVRWGVTGSSEGLLIIGCSRYAEPRPLKETALATGQPRPTDADSFEAQAVVCDYAVQTIH